MQRVNVALILFKQYAHKLKRCFILFLRKYCQHTILKHNHLNKLIIMSSAINQIS